MPNRAEFDFERDSDVQLIGPNRYHATFAPLWSVAETPNGGYVMAMAAKAMADCVEHPHVLTITGHFMARSKLEPLRIETEVLGSSRTTSTVRAVLLQEDRPRSHFAATFVDFDKEPNQLVDMEGAPPDLPPLEDCLSFPYRDGISPPFQQKLQLLFPESHLGWTERKPMGQNLMEGYIGQHEREDHSLFALLMYADAVPPALFNKHGALGWVPTIELTTHIRSLPAPGPIRFRFYTNYIANSFFEEMCELWDSEGKLVTQARQIQKILRRG